MAVPNAALRELPPGYDPALTVLAKMGGGVIFLRCPAYLFHEWLSMQTQAVGHGNNFTAGGAAVLEFDSHFHRNS